MELKERYVYAVVSKLPEKQREEIAKEIHALIDDMMESTEGETEEVRLEKVLLSLGDPSVFADKYREQGRFLIGPKYYTNYIYTLKIVLVAVFIGISISVVVGLFTENVVDQMVNYIPNLIAALMQAFAWVTILFAIFEYKKVDLQSGHEKWSPKKLQPIPHKKARISRGETIVGIVFSTIFLILIYSNLFQIFIPKDEGGYKLIPIFNYDVLNTYKYIIGGIFLIGIAKEVVKLIYGKWNLQLAILYSLLTVVSAILFVFLFSKQEIWNTNLITDIANTMKIDQSEIKFDLSQSIDVLVGICIVGSIIDIVVALGKGFFYSTTKPYFQK